MINKPIDKKGIGGIGEWIISAMKTIRSECCKAPVIVVFFEDENAWDATTMHHTCTSCKAPCDTIEIVH